MAPVHRRALGAGRSNKTDPNDARSAAITALRHGQLRAVSEVGHSEVLRLLAKRNTDIGDHRTRLVARMHALLVELAPGGIAKEINASDVDVFLARLSPATPVEQVRYDLPCVAPFCRRSAGSLPGAAPATQTPKSRREAPRISERRNRT